MSMIESQSWKRTFTLIFFAFQILVFSVETYNFACPSQAHWKFRAKVKCNSTQKYFCLNNIVDGKYVEGCNGPDWDRIGTKRIYAGDFTRGYCFQDRFQPFRFWTNGSMSDCIFAKSICSGDGQLIYKDDSTQDDRACRCDYKNNYSFIKTPRNNCFCIPTEEDCSCYFKSCPVNQTLSSDYSCIQTGMPEILIHNCKDIIEYNKTVDVKTRRCMENNQLCYSQPTSSSKWRDTAETFIIVCLFVGCVYAIFSFTLTIDKLQTLKRYIQRKRKEKRHEPQYTNQEEFAVHSLEQEINGDKDYVEPNMTKEIDVESSHEFCKSTSTDTEQKIDNLRVEKEPLDVEVHKSCEHIRLMQAEVHYLQLIHLLFRVACPIVRMIFNHEIKPNQLRSTLDKNKLKIEIFYRRKEKILSDSQWNLLFGHIKGKTVTSEDFGIRLMIYLLRIIANISVGDLYPVQSDTSIGAMLSRIKFVRNEVTQSLEGNISEDQFIKYWDDIGQAVLKLMSSLEMDYENYQHITGLTDRLFMLSPINIDTTDVCLFIDLIEKLPDVILQKIISEYCMFKGEKIEDILRNEKHDLYHKRINTESCCKCSTKQSPTFVKVIQEKHWDALYEINTSSNSHSCPSYLTKCSECFVPKTINTSDLSVIMTLVLYSTNIMHYIVSRLFSKGFIKFLLDHQHILYHSMDTNMCCKCKKSPTEEILINNKDWNTLFLKENDILCKNSTMNCCCQYSIRPGIKYSDIDETVLFKIFYLAGPIGVLHRIKKNAFLYFIKWTVDADPLRRTLTELLNIVDDKTFRSDMLLRTSSFNLSQSYETETKYDDACEWMSKSLRKQKATTEPPIQIIVRDKDDLRVRSVHIPHDLTLSQRTRNFTDITSEENNFLVVVHGLSKIVYPIVINVFDTHCRNHMLDTIRRDIYEQHCKTQNYDKHRDQRRKMYLSKIQIEQLFSPGKEKSKIVDLELMIYILKENTNEEKKGDYCEQLDVIDGIRKEIVQSSSGMLNDIRFNEIMEHIQRAVLQLGGQKLVGKLSSIQRNQNILE